MSNEYTDTDAFFKRLTAITESAFAGTSITADVVPSRAGAHAERGAIYAWHKKDGNLADMDKQTLASLSYIFDKESGMSTLTIAGSQLVDSPTPFSVNNEEAEQVVNAWVDMVNEYLHP